VSSTRLPAPERRAAVLDCACRVFANGSYRGTTTAEIAAAAGDWPRAARLLGAAGALREATGLALPRSARPNHDRTVGTARRALGEAGLAAASAEGRALSLAEAIDQAVGSAASSTPAAPTRPEHPLAPLTPREWEVVGLIAQRLTNPQIAERLVVSERTVHAHVRNILGKLELASRAQVAAWYQSVSSDRARGA
jgi:non-specific serine/threonine protein kinase